MSEHLRLNRVPAKHEPESQFETPQELVEEPGLTRGEKIAALERWADLVDRRLSAGNEGMPTRGTEPRDAELLQEIEICRETLKKQVDEKSR